MNEAHVSRPTHVSWHIRPATQADAEAAAAVVHAVFDEYGFTWEAEGYHQDLYQLERHYLARGHRFWVAVLGEKETGTENGTVVGTVVGTVALERFPDPLPGAPGTAGIWEGQQRVGASDGSLDRLYVHPRARRLGIGRGLVQCLVQEAQRLGLSRIEIWSDKRYLEAHRLYAQVGAQQVGERICNDPDQSPEWGFQLILTGR